MKVRERLSLRARLGLLYAMLLVISVVLVGSYSYWNIHQLFISNKSGHLRAGAKPIIEHWIRDRSAAKKSSDGVDISSRDALVLARDLTSRNAVAVIVDRHGKIVADGRRLPEEPEAAAPDERYLRRALAGENEITYLDNVKGKPALVLLIPLRPRPGSPRILGVVQLSAGLSEVNRIVLRHGAALVGLTAVILIVGSAAGFWLIGLSLRDLRSLVTACGRISNGDFSQRARPGNRRDEIGQLAESFDHMIDRLEATFASQRRFVANAAHELLTPLTGLRGSLEVLLRGAQDDPAAAARLSRGMYKEVNRLIRLCDRLLGLSRLETASNIRKQRIVLSDFLNEFKQQAPALERGRSPVIEDGPRVEVSADPDLLNQILLNLFSNASRYSPPDAPVVIGLRLLPGEVEISVTDEGTGIDAEVLPHIFEPFFQGNTAPVSGEKGAGLGLALAKSMVEAHQGTIRVESEPGKGAKVLFTLPLE